MKKIILTLVFVFAIGSFSQAEAFSNEISIMKSEAIVGCAEDAFNAHGALTDAGFSRQFASIIADIIYDACVGGY